MIEVINDFINHRKELWLEPRLKKATDEESVQLKIEAAEKFSLQHWLTDAARRAGQLSITTHPSKFTHTSARTTPINAQCMQSNDGYLRSGNVEILSADASGNAAAMDVHSFLLLPISDNVNLLSAFEESNPALKELLENVGLNFEEIRTGFLKMKLGDGVLKTDKLVKQVYFPLPDQDYHLLSILTPSSMIWDMKGRIDSMRFSDQTKQSRQAKREQKYSDGFSELYDLTMIGYGGTKPQVVSVLNNKNFGKAYLLPSIPPLFEKRAGRLPTRNFFEQTLYLKSEQDRFVMLYKLAQQDNNMNVRKAIKNIIQGIIDQILYKAYQLRQNNDKGWSNSEYYQSLPLTQRIWLDEINEEKRITELNWRDDIAKQITSVLIKAYHDINHIHVLSDTEFSHIQDQIVKSIEEDKEFF